MPTQSCRLHGLKMCKMRTFFSASKLVIRYTEIAVLEDMKKGIKFCSKLGVLLSELFKDCGKFELSEKPF